jgi:predicted amidohydrolase
MRALARQHGIWLVPGSLYERAGEGKFYNTTSVIDPEGRLVGRYRKMFPFKPYEDGTTPGDRPFTFDVPEVGRFGVSICYDIWFPETIRWLVAEGAEVIIHPSLTQTIDRDVELAIVRATAACHQCFVIDVNGVGDGGTGKSLFAGPAGEVLHLAGSGPETIPLEIDIDRVRRSREVGLRGLGQPLKSFRDRACEFPIYHNGRRSPHLDALGPLAMPQRGSRAGLDAPHPAVRESGRLEKES